MRRGKGSLTGNVNTTRKPSEKLMKKHKVKGAAKTLKTSKPNEISDIVLPKTPKRN